MGDVATALLVTFVIVGVVLLLVGGLAYYGYREALRPPSPRSLRRMAYALGAFSFFGFGYATAAVVLGEEIPWVVVIPTGTSAAPKCLAAREGAPALSRRPGAIGSHK